MVDLVLQTTAEPIDEELGQTVTTNDISCSSHLQLPEVGSGLGIVRGHTVVSQSKDKGQEETAGAGHNEENGDGIAHGEGTESRGESGNPSVVKGDTELFGDRVLQSLGLKLQGSIFGGGTQTKGSLEGLAQPRETCQQKNGEVGPHLVLDHEPYKCGVLAIGVQFTETLGLFEGPCQEWHGIDIGITVLTGGGGVMKVGNSMVAIVLVLPPLDGKSLHKVAPEQSRVVTVLAVTVHLVMQEVVGKPTTLLEE